MYVYTINKISQLGETDPKYGITYWAEVNETLIPIMFNSMKPVGSGQKITAEEQETKYSKKNTEYLRLKKVRVVESGSSEPENVSESPSNSLQMDPNGTSPLESRLDRIERKIDKLLGLDTPEVDEIKQAVDEVYPVDETKPVDLKDIPF